jgi:hypothetical protein
VASPPLTGFFVGSQRVCSTMHCAQPAARPSVSVTQSFVQGVASWVEHGPVDGSVQAVLHLAAFGLDDAGPPSEGEDVVVVELQAGASSSTKTTERNERSEATTLGVIAVV